MNAATERAIVAVLEELAEAAIDRTDEVSPVPVPRTNMAYDIDKALRAIKLALKEARS